MTQKQKLQNAIKKYMAKHGLNTYRIRKMKLGSNPLGANITTINRILKDPEYLPSVKTVKKICEKIGLTYRDDLGIIVLLKNRKNDI